MRRFAVALLVLAAGCGGSKHARTASPACHVRVYFELDASRAEERALTARLRANEHVARVAFISKAQALRIMKRREPVLTKGLTAANNPLPDALLITPRSDAERADVLSTLRPMPPAVHHVGWRRVAVCR